MILSRKLTLIFQVIKVKKVRHIFLTDIAHNLFARCHVKVALNRFIFNTSTMNGGFIDLTDFLLQRGYFSVLCVWGHRPHEENNSNNKQPELSAHCAPGATRGRSTPISWDGLQSEQMKTLNQSTCRLRVQSLYEASKFGAHTWYNP
jgi:hypothetical protein